MNQRPPIPATIAAPVLAAVDLGPASVALIRRAAEAADSLNAPLRLLHVVHDPLDQPGFYQRRQQRSGPMLPIAALASEMAAELLSQVQQSCPHSAALSQAHWTLISGLPQRRILEVSEQIGARSLFIGANTRTRSLPARLLPSLSGHLVTRSRIPVVALNASKHPSPVVRQTLWTQLKRACSTSAA